MKKDYSIIIPVYNSSSTLNELFEGIKSVFEDIKQSYEVIFVDDSSTDNSWITIEKIKTNNPDIIKAIRLSKNFGQHNATFCGLSFSEGERIITIDDDLQVLPQEIKKLISTFNSVHPQLVYGYFKTKHHSNFRNTGSKLIKTTGKVLKKSKGEGSSFRLFTKEIANNILNHSQNFLYIDELLLWYTDDIEYCEVVHKPRKESKSGYSNLKLIKMALNLMIYYSAIPLRIMTWGGLLSSIITFGFGIFFLIKKIFLHHIPSGYTSLIVAILFSTSLIIFSLGILGEYIYRIYMLHNKKPPYSIKQVL